MFDFLKSKKRRLKESLDCALLQAQIDLLEHTSEDNLPYPDIDNKGWNLLLAGSEEPIAEETLAKVRQISRTLALTNPNAKGIIKNIKNYVLGKSGMGYSVTSDEMSDEQNSEFMEPWWDWYEKNEWRSREKEIIKRTLEDGEVFLRFFNNSEKVRFLEPDQVNDPKNNVSFGIETDPKDVETVKFYYYTDTDGKFREKIPAKEVLHYKIGVNSNVKRGIPFLYVVAKRLKEYDKWLSDRLTLNRVRSAIAIVRKHRATSPSQLNQFANQQSDSSYTDRHGNTVRQETVRGGTIIDEPDGVEYKFLSPEINAPDVKDDGRAILLSVAAGVQQAEYMVTGDASNANYASSLAAESPATKSFEGDQGDYEGFYQKTFKRVMEAKRQAPDGADSFKVVGEKKVEYKVEGPRIVARKRLDEVKGDQILNMNEVLSKSTWADREGLDYEVEKINIANEDTPLANEKVTQGITPKPGEEPEENVEVPEPTEEK